MDLYSVKAHAFRHPTGAVHHIETSRLLAVYGICQLPGTHLVSAIKVLRAMEPNMGLKEAKEIVEYVRDNARLTPGTGLLHIDQPREAFAYLGLQHKPEPGPIQDRVPGTTTLGDLLRQHQDKLSA